jgi:hypothetical protein
MQAKNLFFAFLRSYHVKSLLNYYSVLVDKILFSVFYGDFEDIRDPHVIISVNKLFKLFYTIHYYILCGICMGLPAIYRAQFNMTQFTSTQFTAQNTLRKIHRVTIHHRLDGFSILLDAAR